MEPPRLRPAGDVKPFLPAVKGEEALVVVRSERRTQARLHGRRAKGPHSVAPANEDRDCRRLNRKMRSAECAMRRVRLARRMNVK
jgi:hypothetical protein